MSMTMRGIHAGQYNRPSTPYVGPDRAPFPAVHRCDRRDMAEAVLAIFNNCGPRVTRGAGTTRGLAIIETGDTFAVVWDRLTP